MDVAIDLRRLTAWYGALVALVGVALAPAGAAPREGTPATGTPAQPIGTVLALPVHDYNFVSGLNAGRDRRVRVLHLSRFGAGLFNTEVLTVGITHLVTGEPERTFFLPTNEAGEPRPIHRQLNVPDRLFPQVVLEVGELRIVQVRVNQPNVGLYTIGSTRFFLAPTDGVGALRGANPGVSLREVHRQQMAIGAFHIPASLIALDAADAGSLTVPTPSLLTTLLQMNPNVTPAEQIPGGNTAPARITVKAVEFQ
jgi:hypothetical protein